MILSADPSLLGLGFGVTGTVDAPNIDRAFLRCAPRVPALRAVTCVTWAVHPWMGSLRTSGARRAIGASSRPLAWSPSGDLSSGRVPPVTAV